MAEPVKRGDKYRHIIQVAGVRRTGTFRTKAEARAWEHQLREIARREPESPLLRKRHKLTEAVERYLDTVTITKRSDPAWERRRFNAMIARFPGFHLDEITSDHIARWRDEMVRQVKGSTVNRYFNLYSNLMTVARKEWKWIQDNQFSDVTRPKENDPREQVWGWRQIRAVLREGKQRGGKTYEATLAFHIALRTAMRLQEALAAPSGFDQKRSVVLLTRRKESSRPIEVALTPQGHRLLTKMPKSFRVGANEASTLFSKMLRQMGISGMEFKDSRATALTHMAKRIPIERLRLISRHRDIGILSRTYYRETAEALSRSLQRTL